MTNHDLLPPPGPSGDFNLPPQEPNALRLDEQRLRQVASGISQQGITRDQLIEVNRKQIEGSPLIWHVISYAGDDVRQTGGDIRSFDRGATLGLYLIDQASEGGAPIIGLGGVQDALRYRQQRRVLGDLRMAADDLLASQEALSAAFDEALIGMPEGTDRDIARFGAGITTRAAIIAAQSGGSGVELFEL